MIPFWVLETEKSPSSIFLTDHSLILENRFVKRVIDINLGTTVSITDGDGAEAVSSPLREGMVSVDGKEYFLEGNCEITVSESEFTEKKFEYAHKPYSTHRYPYPAPGRIAELTYHHENIDIILKYEIFDDMPVIRKSLYVKNKTNHTVVVDKAETEALSLTDLGALRYYLESDYTGSNGTGFNTQTSIFRDGNTVSAHFDIGPDYDLPAGETFRGMQVYELFCQSISFDHRMNEVQNMYRRTSPWVCEAPLFIHLISDESKVLRETADMLSDIGYDMIIQSFGSGINLESKDPEYTARVKSDYDYVHSKGLTIGGYTLALIRDYSPMNHDCATNGDHNQISRCLNTKWSEGYWKQILDFLEKTGTDFIEIDGPYHFNTCTGNQPGQTEHLHKGFADSRYTQWLKSTIEIYIKMRELDIYVNTPDWFFLSGTNKCGVGYEEIGFSQPRRVQLLINRIYNYLGTYHKIPSMGWGFLPVEEYHGGGKAAKFEPLTENLDEYDWALAQAAASGVWPCIRGRRLYDTEKCREVVKYWSEVIRQHKTLLNSNTIHVYPPKPEISLDKSQGIDVILQENNTTRDKLFLMVFNQSEEPCTKTLILPAFHTGLTNLKRPGIAPESGSFDNVFIPNFGSWPPVYPKNLENLLEEKTPAEDSGIHMALFEHDLPEKRTEAIIDINGNLILTITLPPMSYTYFVGYKADDCPDAPVQIPEGKPFGLKPSLEEKIVAEETRKIDFEALRAADSVPKVLQAMGLPEDSSEFDGNNVILRAEAYKRIHGIIQECQPSRSEDIIFALAHTSIHTTFDKAVPEDEIWLLKGWKRR